MPPGGGKLSEIDLKEDLQSSMIIVIQARCGSLFFCSTLFSSDADLLHNFQCQDCQYLRGGRILMVSETSRRATGK